MLYCWLSAQPEDPEITCINFEDPNILSTNGVYVFNDGVKVVTDPTLCPEGNNCGFFDHGRLEVAFFANNYDGFERLEISFYYKSVGASGNIEGLITNYCGEDPMETNPDASSLYCALEGDNFSTGLKTPPADVVSNVVSRLWLIGLISHPRGYQFIYDSCSYISLSLSPSLALGSFHLTTPPLSLSIYIYIYIY